MQEDSNRRLAKNTLILYLRMLLTMAVNLYASRVVLAALGVEDYGVYTAVGGFVAMFGVISNSLTAAISRFLTFELGKSSQSEATTGKIDFTRLHQIFSCSILMQLCLGILILILTETLGLWFLGTKMNIPEGSIGAARWVLQFSALTFILNLVSVPYNAAIIAYERMKEFAYISIFEALAKLGIAFAISAATGSRLILYAALLFILALVIRLIYGIYCRRNFEWCRLSLRGDFRHFEGSVIRDIFSFAGWNFIGASSAVLKDQGLNVLLNIFCGPAVTAGRGIAQHVNTAVQGFATSFTTALNPQITKQFAAGSMDSCMTLVMRGARFASFLLALIALPVILEAPTLLGLWLVEVPPYTVIFVRLILSYIMVETLSCTLITLMLATGDIRDYQIVVGGLQLLNFPVAWIILASGLDPAWTIAAAIVISVMCLSARLVMLRKMVGLNIVEYLRDVLLRVIVTVAVALAAPLLLSIILPCSVWRMLLVAVVSLVSTSLSVLYIGCKGSERRTLLDNIFKKLGLR